MFSIVLITLNDNKLGSSTLLGKKKNTFIGNTNVSPYEKIVEYSESIQ